VRASLANGRFSDGWGSCDRCQAKQCHAPNLFYQHPIPYQLRTRPPPKARVHPSPQFSLQFFASGKSGASGLTQTTLFHPWQRRAQSHALSPTSLASAMPKSEAAGPNHRDARRAVRAGAAGTAPHILTAHLHRWRRKLCPAPPQPSSAPFHPATAARSAPRAHSLRESQPPPTPARA
jgi:hypothetical protein